MEEEKKKNFDAVLELYKDSWERIKQRRTYELQASYMLWTALIGVIGFIITTKELFGRPAIVYLLGILVAWFIRTIINVHRRWLVGVGLRNNDDRTIVFEYQDKLHNLADFQFSPGLKDRLLVARQEQREPLDWARESQLTVTKIICAVLGATVLLLFIPLITDLFSYLLRTEKKTMAQFVTLLIAALGVIVAIAAQIVESRRRRLSLSVDVLLKLDKQFNQELLEQRAAAAEGISNGSYREAEDVLDFFETVELFIQRKAVDGKLIWHTFWHWIDGYWVATKDYVRERNRQNPAVYKDFLHLHSELSKIEKKEKGAAATSDVSMTAEELREFLEDEKSLVT